MTKISRIKAQVKIIVQKRNLERMVIFKQLNKLIIQSLLLLNKKKKENSTLHNLSQGDSSIENAWLEDGH